MTGHQHADEKHDPKHPQAMWDAPGDEVSADDMGRKLAEATPTAPLALPVPRHLVEQLRNYGRLRDLVFGYLVVQERSVRYEEIMSDLDDAGVSPDRQFWARHHRQLVAEGLRADFPNDLLGVPEFETLMKRFNTEHAKARTAAMAGRNPHQSAQSAGEAYEAVTAILEIAEELGTLCKGQARALLNDLYDTVNKIFADDVRSMGGGSAPSERSIGASLAETEEDRPASVTREKDVARSTSGAATAINVRGKETG
jgi:hypothetical protein